jgi:hypothetical protein
LVEGDAELRDIKPQAELPYTNLLPWIIGAMLIAGILGGAVLWRRRRQTSQAQAAVDKRLSHEVALDELKRIGKMGLPESGRYKEHYTLVSDCMRVYMEQTFQIPVMERTTSEIRSSLKGTTITTEVSQQFIALLDESDLVKFSNFTPDATSAYQLLETGRRIVEDTKPILENIGEKNEPTGNPHPNHPADGRNQPSEVTA